MSDGSLRVWTCVDHDAVWPVPRASIVVAHTEQQARALLDRALIAAGLRPNDYTLEPVALSEPHAIVLQNGDY